jgi:outer membrane receptor protein involved in Fe transport
VAAQGEIIVTAQRREESILKVPISITAYSTEQMDKQGIRGIRDLSRLTPSLTFTRTAGVSGNNGTNIAIRGISSDVGAATTAIYIDDTPIQIRSIGYFGGNPYPRIFDLDRVEVLRGPQGTLFGASAEGGAVRFITDAPSFSKTSVYGRSEISSTEHGALSYEGGASLSTPLADNLAVRVSGWYRRDGGYIDRVNPATGALVAPDINSQNTYVGRITAAWQPLPDLTITPAFYYQKVKSNGRDQFWEGYGKQSDQNYATGIYNSEPGYDRFYMPSLKMQYNMGSISVISNTSYFVRDEYHALDYSTFLSQLRTGSAFGVYNNRDLSNAMATQNMGQRVFTQEARVQSYSPDSLVDWVAGVYYSRAIQTYQNLSGSGLIPGVLSRGVTQYQGRYNIFDSLHARDEQIAGFANVDIKPLAGLKITFGGRVTSAIFQYNEILDGPTYANVRQYPNGYQKETAFTPKAGISYDIDHNNMVYASASKGFRPGGAQSPVDPTFCGTDLTSLGLTGSPTQYKSDSLWSYEAGTKNKLFGGKVMLDVNAYVTKWKNIQQSIRLPTCSFSFVTNLGGATSKGTDISVSVTPIKGLTLGGNVGYNDTTLDEAVVGGNGLVIRAKGTRIGGPKWSGSVYGQGDFPIDERVTGYARADLSFASSGTYTPLGNYGYDPDLYGSPAYTYLSLRAGLRFSPVDVSLFVDNVTNASPALSRGDDTVGGTLRYVETYRPRTIGLTGTIRY